MQVWKQNELKRAYHNVLYAMHMYGAHPSNQNWIRFYKSAQFFQTLGGEVYFFGDVEVVYISFRHP